jgi:hypothetical protein
VSSNKAGTLKKAVQNWTAFFAGLGGTVAFNHYKSRFNQYKKFLVITAGSFVITRVINHYKQYLISISISAESIHHYKAVFNRYQARERCHFIPILSFCSGQPPVNQGTGNAAICNWNLYGK